MTATTAATAAKKGVSSRRNGAVWLSKFGGLLAALRKHRAELPEEANEVGTDVLAIAA